MTRTGAAHSPTPEAIAAHYASGYEADRLLRGAGRLDRERSRELLGRFLPRAPAVVLFGPLYHLTDRADRVQALREARRVLRPGGALLAAAISRFASALDGLCRGFLRDPQFAEIVRRDLTDGQHRNPTGRPEYFMDTFFHHPDELRAEVGAAGFGAARVYGVEGPGWLLSDFDAWWDDGACRDRLLQLARALEAEPSLSGVSAHLMAVATR